MALELIDNGLDGLIELDTRTGAQVGIFVLPRLRKLLAMSKEELVIILTGDNRTEREIAKLILRRDK